MEKWFVLFPTIGGELAPIPARLAPPFKWVDDDGIIQDSEYMPLDKGYDPKEPAQKYVFDLLVNRKAYIQAFDLLRQETAITRDEVIEFLSLKGSDRSGIRVQHSLDPDSIISRILDGGSIDKTYSYLSSLRLSKIKEATSLILDIEKLDNLITHLPGYQKKFINIMFYIRRPPEAVKSILRLSDEEYVKLLVNTVTELAKRYLAAG